MILNQIKHIRVGTRPSLLAQKQVQEIAGLLPAWDLEIVPIATEGDRDKITSLTYREGSDFFTGTIEQALLDGEIDIAVHSAKDLETNIPEGLKIIALTRSVSPYDALVSRNNESLDTLPPRSIVGTSSQQRQAAIKRVRKDLIVKDIRGNIDSRLAQLDAGAFDAIIVAHAALLRLGHESRIAEIIPTWIIEPHPLQGRLAVQIRKDRDDLKELFEKCHEK
jgi:hydroxymethylbilane synthase